MQFIRPFFLISTAIFIWFDSESVEGRKLINVNEVLVSKTVTVDRNGKGDFTRVQDAIDSVPTNNNQWIKIQVNEGTYVEKITNNRSFILLTGMSSRKTIISYYDHGNDTVSTATFYQDADNFVAKNITFKNSYNHPWDATNDTRTEQALAMNVDGDKVAFYECGFVGFQDTLLDLSGRHYFKHCHIEGSIDFIWGNCQSIYERCNIKVIASKSNPGPGYITAQGKDKPDEPTGFVFKYSTVTGDAHAFLGRAWRPYSTVLFYRSLLTKAVVPQGWSAWGNPEVNISYGESECIGAGSDTMHRVPWEKKFSAAELAKYTAISFIDKEGWLKQQP